MLCGPPLLDYVLTVAPGSDCIFIKCDTGAGWLPLTTPSDALVCFQDIGRKENLSNAKLSSLQFFIPGRDAAEPPAPVAADPPPAPVAEPEPEEPSPALYVCLAEGSGVAYRNSPNFADKVPYLVFNVTFDTLNARVLTLTVTLM